FKTHRFSDRVGAVGNAFAVLRLAAKQHVTKAAGRVEMSAGRSDSKGRNEHAWSNDVAFVDRIAQSDIDELFAARKPAAHLAHPGGTCLQWIPGADRNAQAVPPNV